MELLHIDSSPAPRAISSPSATRGASCGTGCSCSNADRIDSSQTTLSPGQLLLTSFLVFLLPIGTAVAGAALWTSPAMEALGAIAGLMLGALLARVITRQIVPREE